MAGTKRRDIPPVYRRLYDTYVSGKGGDNIAQADLIVSLAVQHLYAKVDEQSRCNYFDPCYQAIINGAVIRRLNDIVTREDQAHAGILADAIAVIGEDDDGYWDDDEFEEDDWYEDDEEED